jgi:hypothetical protein
LEADSASSRAMTLTSSRNPAEKHLARGDGTCSQYWLSLPE